VRSDWVNAMVPLNQDLEFQAPKCDLKIPPPTREIFSPVIRFFHEIYQLYHSEAAVLLHFNMTEKVWAFTVPEQTASAAHVHYEMTDRLPGFRCVGTMHSHGHMGASHSHVDTRDEAEFDGLHITIGSLTKFPDFDLDAEILVRGHRFKVDPTRFPGISRVSSTIRPWNNRCVLEGLADETQLMVQQEWIDRVKADTWRTRPTFGRHEVIDPATELLGLDVTRLNPVPTIPVHDRPTVLPYAGEEKEDEP